MVPPQPYSGSPGCPPVTTTFSLRTGASAGDSAMVRVDNAHAWTNMFRRLTGSMSSAQKIHDPLHLVGSQAGDEWLHGFHRLKQALLAALLGRGGQESVNALGGGLRLASRLSLRRVRAFSGLPVLRLHRREMLGRHLDPVVRENELRRFGRVLDALVDGGAGRGR